MSRVCCLRVCRCMMCEACIKCVHLLLLTNSLIGQVIGTMHVTRVLFTCVSAYDV